jgi:hypothetical protein
MREQRTAPVIAAFALLSAYAIGSACVPPLPEPAAEMPDNAGSGGAPVFAGRGGATGRAGTGGPTGWAGAGGPTMPTGAAATGGSATGTGGPTMPTGAAGTGGAGGSPGMCQPTKCATLPNGCYGAPPIGSPVSDFESGCGDLAPVDGRDGGWFVYANGTTIVDPDPDEPFRVACAGAFGSCFSACITGTLSGDGTEWPSVGLGFVPRAAAALYDVTRYRGISFVLAGRSGPNSIARLLAPLAADTRVEDGGTCTANCFDAYMAPLSPLPNTWQRIEIPFLTLRQQGFGPSEPWDPTTVISFQWTVSAASSSILAPEPFALCVDQVELIPW